ncbi:MAG: hypothetical protein ACO3RG_00965, partial [Nitriliruptoraceae bacterium]
MQGHHEGVVRVRGAEPLSAFDVVESAPGRAVVRVLGGRLEVTVHRTGTFRVRTLVDAPAPEYGILTDDGARPDPGAVAAPETGVADAGAAGLRLRSGAAAL